jgi:hypothetical protein
MGEVKGSYCAWVGGQIHSACNIVWICRIGYANSNSMGLLLNGCLQFHKIVVVERFVKAMPFDISRQNVLVLIPVLIVRPRVPVDFAHVRILAGTVVLA